MEKGAGKIIIVGAAGMATFVKEIFMYDSPHSVVGFTVEKEYMKSDEFDGLPVVAMEEIEEHYAPQEHFFHVALGYYGLNRHRERLINLMVISSCRVIVVSFANCAGCSNLRTGDC